MLTASTASSRHCRRRRGEESTIRNWSDIPEGPLHTILACLSSLVDFISFSSACRSWRAVASSLSPSQITSFFPPLLLCSSYTCRHRLSGLRLLDPASPSFSCSLDRNFNNVSSVGFSSVTSHGRLLRWFDHRIEILNPFTGDELFSPLFPKGHSSPFQPLRSSYLFFTGSTLLLFTSDTLFYWHIGTPTWSCHSPRIKPARIVNVAIVKGKVYAMDSAETLFVLDLSPQLHLRQLAVDGFGKGSFSFYHFLVDCGGELLLLRLVPTEEVIRAQLEVFQLDLSADRAGWVKKETLGNWAIFIEYESNDTQVPGLAVENPERWGGQSNCLYFATGNENGDWPWVVIKFGDEIDTWDPESPLFVGNSRLRHASSWVRPCF